MKRYEAAGRRDPVATDTGRNDVKSLALVNAVPRTYWLHFVAKDGKRTTLRCSARSIAEAKAVGVEYLNSTETLIVERTSCSGR